MRRHATRLQAGEFGAREVREWYRSRDLLATIREHVIPETSTVQQTIGLIAADAQLAQRPGPLMAGRITYDNAPPDDPSGRMRT